MVPSPELPVPAGCTHHSSQLWHLQSDSTPSTSHPADCGRKPWTETKYFRYSRGNNEGGDQKSFKDKKKSICIISLSLAVTGRYWYLHTCPCCQAYQDCFITCGHCPLPSLGVSCFSAFLNSLIKVSKWNPYHTWVVSYYRECTSEIVRCSPVPVSPSGYSCLCRLGEANARLGW